MLIRCVARKVGKVGLRDLVWEPCVLGVVVEFKYDIVVLFVASGNIFDFERSSQVSLDVKDLAVEQDEGISVAAIFEDEGVDSLCLGGLCGGVVVLGVDTVEGVDVVLAAWNGVVSVHVDWGGGVIGLPVGEVAAPVWAGSVPDLISGGVVLADSEVMWGPVNADVGFKKTAVKAGAGSYWSSNVVGSLEVLTGDGSDSGGILVLDSEGSIDETSATVLFVDTDGDALVGYAEHLDDHLIVGDPWGDAEPVGDEEGVVVPCVDVVEGDRVWLGSASAHAEDLVAVWVVVEVLVLLGVGHQEGEVVALEEWVDTPVVDALVAVGFGVFEPAVSLVGGVSPDPILELVFSEGLSGNLRCTLSCCTTGG